MVMSMNGDMRSRQVEKYRKFLRGASLPESDSPMEATVRENGFVLEGRGLPAVDLEKRIVGNVLMQVNLCCVDMKQLRSHTGFEIGSQGSADVLRCTNIVKAMKSRRSSLSPNSM